MGQTERLQIMRDWLKTTPELSLEQLMDRFTVSRDTARRDLIRMEEEGDVIRVKNGAIRSRVNLTARYEDRIVSEDKLWAAREAAKLVQANERILFDASTTVAAMIQFLPNVPITAVTNSLDIAEQLGQREEVELYVTGGKFDPHHRSLYGLRTAEDILDYQVDKVFIGACGLTGEGLFAENLEEAVVKKAMVRSAGEVVVLAAEEKFSRRFLHRVCPLGKIDRLITKHVPKSFEALIAETETSLLRDDEKPPA
ncbi:DeoR/GlpR family DNA-binding transcription regulator [Exiguobacterium flavidum]|uniref:DeoR/GlpR family DNA-binding transcription regulator n=1 Tax=Exiguobacterium flavidum TaxID=2184695 RepID=UPI000DF7B20A|nr:DeoR/GlpR family DNA-binding transcription regulator [Exiguobacterium flavidum]